MWAAFFTSVCASGVLAVGISYLLNGKKERRERKRDKAEELYIEFHRWYLHLSGYYLNHYYLYDGRVGYNEFLDMSIEHDKSRPNFDPGRIIMIIEMYFPELKSSWLGIDDKKKELNGINSYYKEEYGSTPMSDDEAYGRHQNGFKELIKRCEQFQRQVVAISKRI